MTQEGLPRGRKGRHALSLTGNRDISSCVNFGERAEGRKEPLSHAAPGGGGAGQETRPLSPSPSPPLPPPALLSGEFLEREPEQTQLALPSAGTGCGGIPGLNPRKPPERPICSGFVTERLSGASPRHGTPARQGPARTPRSRRPPCRPRSALRAKAKDAVGSPLPPSPGPPRGAEREALEGGFPSKPDRRRPASGAPGPRTPVSIPDTGVPARPLARKPREKRAGAPPASTPLTPSASRREAATHLCPPRVATRRPASCSPGRSEAHTASRGHAR